MLLLFMLLQIFAIAHGKGILLESVEMSLSDGDGVQAHGQAFSQQEKVKFQLYYETRCPFCVTLYTTELKDAVNELAPYLDISTYPYGKAKMELNGTRLTIVCQHGEDECYGNMLHACAIDALKDFKKYFSYNSCMMNYHTTELSNDEAADKCGKELNVDSDGIKECAKSIRGFQLLLHYGIESLRAKYTGVPFWCVNGVRRDTSDQRPLMEILCAAFKNPPVFCKK